MRTIVSGTQDVGEDQEKLNTHEVGSGVYIVRLQAGNRIATRKVTCVK